MRKGNVLLFAIMFCLFALTIWAIKTQNVELGNQGIYDGQVKINRSEDGKMLFIDETLTSPVCIKDFLEGVRIHSELSGLAQDDHPLYLTQGRHSLSHTTTFDNLLLVGPDVNNNTTLGAHLQDSNMHPRKNFPETIAGLWKFQDKTSVKKTITDANNLEGLLEVLMTNNFGSDTSPSDIKRTAEKCENVLTYSGSGLPTGSFNLGLESSSESNGSQISNLKINTIGAVGKGKSSGSNCNAIGLAGFADSEGVSNRSRIGVYGGFDSEVLDSPTSMPIGNYAGYFAGNVYVDGSIYGQGSTLSGIEKKKAQIITVAKEGGDWTLIQSAVDSITDASPSKPYTILVSSGVYNEQVTLKDYVSLIGMDRKSSKVISNQASYVIKLTKGEVRNIYVENLRSAYPSVAIYMSDGESLVTNCDVYSHAQDTVICYGGRLENSYLSTDCSFGGTADTLAIYGSPTIKNCIIENENEPGSVWISGGAGTNSPKFYDCVLRCGNTSSACVRIQDAIEQIIKAYFFNCKFLKWDWTPTFFIKDEAYGAYTTVYHAGCVYSYKGEPACTYVEVQQGDQNLTSLKIGGTERIDSTGIGNFYRLKIQGTERINDLGVFTGIGSALTLVNADQLDGKHLGTSGSTVPSCDTVNTFSANQAIIGDLSASGGINLGTATGAPAGSVYAQASSTGFRLLNQSSRSFDFQSNASSQFVVNSIVTSSGLVDKTMFIGYGSSGIMSFPNKVGIGATTPATEFQVVSTSASSPRGIMSSQHTTDTQGARFHLRKARGTLASPTVIISGDMLGRLVASGYDGSNYLEMAGIDINCEGTIATTRVPTRISFWTATDATPSVLTERMRIDNAGNSQFINTRWKDWSAVAQCGLADPYYWIQDMQYLETTTNEARIYFPIPYEAGTILSRLRVKWLAEGESDGVKVRIVKRNESSTDGDYTTVGAQQTYTDSSYPYEITVSTYDFSDETMQENYSYSIEVQSVVSSIGVKVYSIGIETAKRVF